MKTKQHFDSFNWNCHLKCQVASVFLSFSANRTNFEQALAINSIFAEAAKVRRSHHMLHTRFCYLSISKCSLYIQYIYFDMNLESKRPVVVWLKQRTLPFSRHCSCLAGGGHCCRGRWTVNRGRRKSTSTYESYRILQSVQVVLFLFTAATYIVTWLP